MTPAKSDDPNRLVAVTLDENSIGRSSPDVEHERAVAIYDLIEENSFAPVDHDGGPYALNLSLAENRLVFDIRLADGEPVMAHMLSLSPFKRIVKDYFLICDSYYEAIRTATPDRIEAIDMGRRGLHDEGSRILQERIKRKVDGRFRHRAPAVHADLRAALEGLSRHGRAAAQRKAAGGAVRLRAQLGALADGGGAVPPVAGPDDLRGLGRRAQGRARSVRGRRDGGDRASTSPSTGR